ncbi:MAG: hypothetical protein AAF739_05190 [Pseudomonadota bacterium]
MVQSARPQPQLPDDEEPLDPRLEAMAAKMRRLSLVSSGIMFLGIFAVLGVILYRSLADPSSAPPAENYPVPIPAEQVRQLIASEFPGAVVTALSQDDRSLFVATNGPQFATIIEVDRATWQVVGVIRLGE